MHQFNEVLLHNNEMNPDIYKDNKPQTLPAKGKAIKMENRLLVARIFQWGGRARLEKGVIMASTIVQLANPQPISTRIPYRH